MARHTRQRPCPVCGGYDAATRGSDRRCHGFTSADGAFAHCSQVACGELEAGNTYAHRLVGDCRCGSTHGTVDARPADATTIVDHVAAWSALDRRSLVGERYLQTRGLDPRELCGAGVVRYHARHGSPAIALRDLTTGEIVGIQYRRVDGGEPKVITAKGSRCGGAALNGRIAELDREGVDVAIVVEGFADTLAAVLAWPGCAVFGAAGAGQLATVAAAVARRIAEVGGWTIVVPHDDDDGVRAGVAAVRAAQQVGIALDRDLLLADLGEHNDLADALRAGWRWQWPQLREQMR